MRKNHYLTGLIVFLISFCLYVRTLCPTIYTQDSGEFVTVACTLGVAHPSGYPLYALLGRVFSLSGFNSPAFRVNLLSAFFASLTVALVYFIILELCGGIMPAIFGAVCLMSSPILWSLSTVAEVYSLAAFFVALLMLVLMLKDEKGRCLYLFSFLFGLGLTNHQTLLLCGIAFLYLILYSKRIVSMSASGFLTMFLLFFLGLSLYLYMPVRAVNQPVLNWGNPDTLRRFVRILTRADYGSLELGAVKGAERTGSFMVRQAASFLASLINQFNMAGFLCGLAGLYFLIREKSGFSLFTSMLFLLTGPFFALLANMPLDKHSIAMLEVFYLPSMIVFSIWAGFAVSKISARFKPLALIIPAITLIVNFTSLDRSKNYCARDYGMNVLASLPENAIIFAKRDETRNSVWYLQLVEKKRTDVKLIVLPLPQWWTKEVERKWPGIIRRENIFGEGYVRGIVTDNVGIYPVYTDNITDAAMNEFYDHWMPHGVVFAFSGTKTRDIPLEEVREKERVWEKYDYRNECRTASLRDLFSKELIHYYAEARFNLAAIYHNRGMYEDAAREFARALDIDPGYEDAKTYYEMDRKVQKPL